MITLGPSALPGRVTVAAGRDSKGGEIVVGPVSLQQWIVAIAETGAGVFVALVLRTMLRRLASRARGTQWLQTELLLALASLLPWATAIAGIWAALLTLPLSGSWRNDADHGLLALTILGATLVVARVAGDTVRAGAQARSGVAASATIFVNITRIVVLAIGFLVLLDGLGVAITPLLTALGVGGLAVALALQDTLTNLFAGIHIMAAGKIQPGDFIQLDNGMQGHLVDTNWRNTTIRQLPNNLVIVPNSSLASSVVTNYHRPEQEVSVSVQVGVAYDSDLEHVERVSCEVGLEIMREVPGAVPGYQPSVRYQAFGESGVNFSVNLRAARITDQYVIVHEFIKRLHSRFRHEGIEIPYQALSIVPSPGMDPREIETAGAGRLSRGRGPRCRRPATRARWPRCRRPPARPRPGGGPGHPRPAASRRTAPR
ncbi:MAG: mechanosensitive ion channel family protein [Actinobacteria bacterium]|nr:mechanosensitive ion channel family protein [Actinomycetota bacterium]